MSKKQVMLIGLDPTEHDVEYLFDNDEILFHLAEDVEEAVETVEITPVEMLIVNASLVEGAASEFVERLHLQIEAPHLPVVVLVPERIGEAEIFYRTGDQAEYAVRRVAPVPASHREPRRRDWRWQWPVGRR